MLRKGEQGRYKYSREEGRREMLAAVGGSSERAWHKEISSLLSSALSGR